VMREKAPEWLRHIALKQPDFASYLYYMMERLRACHDVLKPTGSIYLHCDYRASHYLKMTMDEIFGYDKFRNEIVWFYPFAGRSKSTFPKKHDTLFWYSKSSKYVFNDESPLVRIPITEKSVIHNYRYFDENGRQYRSDPRKSGKTYRYYLDAGKIPEDVWTDIPSLHFELSERVGYPTQKPEKLLERIIGAHTKEGDMVLDPFCGCGTSVIVAGKLKRNWVGVDIDTSPREKGQLPRAFRVIQNRSHPLFDQATYTTRDLSEINEMDGNAFEAWVNEFYKATKPWPDKGVDGITPNGIPIQAKVYLIKYPVLSEFVTNAKLHHAVPKPIKEILVVSQTGFDDGARKRKFEIETADNIKVRMETPETMLRLE